MRFRMERRAPYALAVQLVSAGAGLALLLVQQLSPLPPPGPCDGAAQIVYDSGRTCHAGLDAMFRALAAPAQPGFVRAVYVRPADGPVHGPWVGARQATYVWQPGTLAAYAAPQQAQAARRSGGGRLLPYGDVVEITVHLVTKE